MKTCTALVALVLATAVAGSANAASKHHHHHAMHTAKAGTASTSDWPGNPYMDLQQSQVERFWRDAFDPYDATKK